MPSPSLAERVLELVWDIRETLAPLPTSELPLSSASLAALMLSVANLEDAAKRRLNYSENERIRRATSTADSVTAQRGPCE